MKMNRLSDANSTPYAWATDDGYNGCCPSSREVVSGIAETRGGGCTEVFSTRCCVKGSDMACCNQGGTYHACTEKNKSDCCGGSSGCC